MIKPNLKGFMVGNGVTNWKYDTEPAFLEMGYWHSLYDTKTYDMMQEKKCDYSSLATGGKLPSDECMDLYNSFATDTEKLNIYDIFGYCYNADEDKMKGFTAAGRTIGSYKRYWTA